ncbi:hypothetical protein OCK74_05910 [Chitinophagaceae bacterium LB-8]|uniref:Uncharacterized protein n=1 Tax=Paraflavisolibacter caeni TaxID=2982496 RepID=A0A9X2XUL2_9BACT|nr:hypothetical protein [Paraflavisolibacter caeni]MCU7548642.1 hypothetical protein [Paraflavisolibacter caeni]
MFKKKVVTAVLLTASLAAFATFGEGGRKDREQGLLLLNKSRYLCAKTFSLKSHYNYRGNQVLTNSTNRYIVLNTNITYQRGNNTYILPLKRKVLLDKVTINSTPVQY